MFKKDRDLTERSKTLLKNKEIRTLRSEVKKQYPLADEELLATVIGNKADVTCVKLSNRTILYEIDGKVILFDLEGRNNLFPTLHMLWKLPDMMRTFYTYGPVSKYVLKGADFMVPGLATLEGLAGLKEREKCCIKILGNPLPFAVGESQVGFTYLNGPGEKKGKAIGVLHVYGDLLAHKDVPNEGFTLQQIKPLAGSSTVEEDESDDDNDSDEADDNPIEVIKDGRQEVESEMEVSLVGDSIQSQHYSPMT